MDEQLIPRPDDTALTEQRVTDRLLVFFALVYVVEGVGQVSGLIANRSAIT